MKNSLLSVGIDIGTTTSQLIFSRLHIVNQANPFSVPDYGIQEKEILYRSKIHFTPLLSEDRIDVEALRQIIDQEYETAGVEKSHVQTGAVIITGETARKENAREVLTALSGYAGEFVVATAGPALESILAGKGSGAEDYAGRHKCKVMNLDIGGGTTNFATFEKGRLIDTGCLNVGGRLMKFREGKCYYLSPVLQKYFTKDSPPEKVARFLCEILEQAVGLRDGKEYIHFITDKACEGAELLSFSGGVADLIPEGPQDPFLYGDLGVLLGRAIRQSPLWQEGRRIPSVETIRATVIGAGLHTTELSGSTIFYKNIHFPIKNLPVAHYSYGDICDRERQIPSIRAEMERIAPGNDACILSVKGIGNLKFRDLCDLADAIALSMAERASVFLAVEEDVGKALGQAVHSLLPHKPILCVDGIRLPEHSYLDVGMPLAGGSVLPVVIKTLIL